MDNRKSDLRYLDLKSDICEQIYKGTYLNGECIPSERQLTVDYNVSRITVRKALELLEDENLIKREVGKGTILQYRNWGNENPIDMLALVAPSKNPFFSKFIAEFQKIAWERGALMLYIEIPENTSLEDCLFRLYQRNIRNVVIWPDDQEIHQEKLLRLRSIGMNLVFFDTDEGYPYADCVYLDNEEAIRKLISKTPKTYKKYYYVGWDRMEIANIQKRESAFRGLCPEGSVLHIPWRRDRKIAQNDLQIIEKHLSEPGESIIVCGAGEIGQQIAGYLYEKRKISVQLAVIDEFDGSDNYHVSVYEQNLTETAEVIYEQMYRQTCEGKNWCPKMSTVKGNYIIKNEKGE